MPWFTWSLLYSSQLFTTARSNAWVIMRSGHFPDYFHSVKAYELVQLVDSTHGLAATLHNLWVLDIKVIFSCEWQGGWHKDTRTIFPSMLVPWSLENPRQRDVKGREGSFFDISVCFEWGAGVSKTVDSCCPSSKNLLVCQYLKHNVGGEVVKIARFPMGLVFLSHTAWRASVPLMCRLKWSWKEPLSGRCVLEKSQYQCWRSSKVTLRGNSALLLPNAGQPGLQSRALLHVYNQWHHFAQRTGLSWMSFAQICLRARICWRNSMV